MKRLLMSILILTTGLHAQNLQIHYDFRQDEQPLLDRGYTTATLEMFQPDRYGATFWFVDMDFDGPNSQMSLAYWEIARYLSLGESSRFSLTVQFNDGLASYGGINQVWLGGVSYDLTVGNWNIPLDFLYRHVTGGEGPNLQLTAVWNRTVWHDRLQLAGYIDLYTQDPLVNRDSRNELAIQAEPQVWTKLSAEIWIGGELEISRYFLPVEGWQLYPTLGLKWDF